MSAQITTLDSSAWHRMQLHAHYSPYLLLFSSCLPSIIFLPSTEVLVMKITKIEYFRVLPRWLFIKITDASENYGWGEATLEGHTLAVEGCLDSLRQRFVGYEAE